MSYRSRLRAALAILVLALILYVIYDFTIDANASTQQETLQSEKKNQQGAGDVINFVKNSTRKLTPPHFVPNMYKNNKEALKSYVKYLNEVEEPLAKQDTAVILLTNYRSGSTFFGELFNQHPDVFFIYEPVWPLSYLEKCTNPDLKMQVLKGLVQCELPNWRKIYQDLPYEKQIARPNWIVERCLNQDMCFQWKTKELCNTRHCPGMKTCGQECGSINFQLVNNECRRKKMAVMKTIRICDILDFEEMFTNMSTNVKIVHLIRDPRAIASSSLQINSKANVDKLLSGICSRQYHNLRSAVQNTPEWLKGKYMVVRYEDVAVSPYEKMESIYNFIGLDFPDGVKNWIHKNTKIPIPAKFSTTNKSRKRRAIRSLLKMLVPGREDPYGTSRDSRANVKKWVRNLPYQTTKLVERVCSDIMHLAGYKPLRDREEYNVNNDVQFFIDEKAFLKNVTHFP